MTLGVSPEVSLRRLAEQTGVVEMKIFVMARLIQRQIGGNLADILERLAGLIRERQRLRDHTRTLTAEGRMQALVLRSRFSQPGSQVVGDAATESRRACPAARFISSQRC